jgi:hypothetical protein
MTEKERRLPFGRKVRCGNFTVLKYTRTLSRSEMKELRDDLPRDMARGLTRSGVPYIRVEAISGIWSVQFACNTQVFNAIDTGLALALDGVDGFGIDEFSTYFLMMMSDTLLLGDDEYVKAKGKAMMDFLDRQKAAVLSGDDDAAILERLRNDEEAKAVIMEMKDAMLAEKGGGDD